MELECQSPLCITNREKGWEPLFEVRMTVTCTKDLKPDPYGELADDLAVDKWAYNGLRFRCHYCDNEHVYPEEDEDGTAQTATS